MKVKFVDIETFGYGYDNLNILVNINGCIKQYAPHRVYIRKFIILIYNYNNYLDFQYYINQ